ncbi:MAG: arylsulfatase [Planctomycetota bacterium]
MFAIRYLGLCLLFGNACVHGDRVEHPNVILIVTDDQGYGDMSCHGNPWLETPSLDRLASQSVQLTDYHVDPVCTPTRAALMTGRYCTRVGAWTVTEGRQLLQADELTIAEAFSKSGYRTGMFGKWHLGDTRPYAPRFRGFDRVVRHQAGGVDEIGNPSGNDFFDDIYYRNGNPEQFSGYCTDIFFQELTDFIKEDSERPFFAYLPLNAMHSPHTVADRYVAPFTKQGHPIKRAKFYGMIANFDENLGRLLETIKREDLESETVVIFMGDNGSAAGPTRPGDTIPGFNAGMRGQKGSTYEGGHRVACFVRWTGEFRPGLTLNQLTSHRDWFPTLVELCGLSIPSIAFDGRSILPLLRGEADSWPERTLFIQRQGDQPMLPDGSKKKRKYPRYAVLTERWRMVDGELYDHEKDPGQKINVADQHPSLAEDLVQRFADHFQDVFVEGLPYARFVLGGDENPVQLTVREWHPIGKTSKDRQVIWQQKQLDDDSVWIKGFWEIDVISAGRYSIRLSRFPDDASSAMRASRAELRIGDIMASRSINPSDESVRFVIDLPKGPARVEATLTDADSKRQRGAYFVTADRLD